jgi:hypothetical protein
MDLKMKTPIVKLLFVLLAGLLIQLPMYATCTQGTCVTPPSCGCLDQIADPTFDDGCPNWSEGGEAYLGNSGSNYYWDLYEDTSELENAAYIVQTVTVPSNKTTISVHVDVDMFDINTSGTEKLAVDILSTGGTLLEVVGYIRPLTGSDYYILNTSGYGGQTVKVRIRYRPAQFPAGTIFRIKEVHFLTC